MARYVDLDRFRIVTLTRDLQSEFDLAEMICADPDGLPFVEGQAFYDWLIDRNGCQEGTAKHYLKAALAFLTFLWSSTPALVYTAPAEQIRDGIQRYLKDKLGCVLRPHPGGNLQVRAARAITRHSVRLYLVALKHFYECAVLQGWYADSNPLVWKQRLMPHERGFEPSMPPKSGMTLPEHRQGRVPDTFFCVIDDEWRPQIIDDPNLPRRLIAAFPAGRDHIIGRMLFESGARIGEVLGLTLGAWRHVEGQRHGALATNKGSWGERVKEIWWSSDTTRLLSQYVNTERRRSDELGRALEALPDAAPVFVTTDGQPYTYPAFYYHWRRACSSAEVKMHPHQARHWFVTAALRRIKAVSNESQRQAYRQRLVTYLGWKNGDTIKAYDHHLQLTDFGPIHAAISDLVRSGSTAQPPHSLEHPADNDRVSNGIPEEIWSRLSELIDDDGE